MEIIQIKEIEFDQDDRGWSIRPITDEEISAGRIKDIHIVSIMLGGSNHLVHPCLTRTYDKRYVSLSLKL